MTRDGPRPDLIYEHKYRVPNPARAAGDAHLRRAAGRQREDHALSSSQSPFAQRNLIAKALHISHSKLRVITPYVGGGFGCKAGVSMEGAAVALREHQGRPVKLRMTREEEFYTTFVRQGPFAYVQNGHDPGRPHHRHAEPFLLDGRRQHRVWDEHHPRGRLQRHRPYFVPNIHVDSMCVYTNHPSAARCAGSACRRSTGASSSTSIRWLTDWIGPPAGAAVELPQGGRRNADRDDHAPNQD